MEDIPYDIRDGALLVALVAYRAGKKLEKKLSFSFKLKHRTKKAILVRVHLQSRLQSRIASTRNSSSAN